MLNVTIQNDGKIKIQTECSDVKEMRSKLLKIKMIKNGCKIIREAGSQSWPTDCDSRDNNIVTHDIEVSSAAKSCNRHNGLQG